ncbi:MAG: TatD family hydrolase [Oscillospiraceae bacterium]|nr:TatD family hydrolase [Oscillospiraceae bacterium]
MFFDTHAHYDDIQFDEDRNNLLSSLPDSGISLVVNPGCDMETSEKAIRIAESYPFIYAAVGYHPHYADKLDDAGIAELRRLSGNARVVAIGEIGLDYYRNRSPRDSQQEAFRRQLELARELELPVIVHEREAPGDTLSIIAEYDGVCGVCLCFSGSWESAKTLLDRGWYLSFAGPVTYRNSRKAPEVAAKMPLDRLLIETDSPYLSPEPMRGRRNSSLNLHYTAEKIAEIRGIDVNELAEITMENGKRLFRIND